jgi:outer membrane protein assembly factor BamB
MPRPITLFASLSLIFCLATTSFADDWMQWRGPTNNGIASKDQTPPVTWSESENVVWKKELPGSGHGSPTLFAGRIFLATASDSAKTQSVMCYTQMDGKKLWETEVHRGNFAPKIYPKNTHASQTIACDGKAIFVTFDNDGAIFLTKLDLDGKVLWQKRTGGYDTFYKFGYGASPTIYKSTVIVSAESKVGFLVAYDRESGNEVWRTDRKRSSYSSPIVGMTGGRQQLLISGGSEIGGFDPDTGKQLWKVPTIWQVSCGTLVWDDGKVFASGGFPKAQTYCVKSDGSGQVVWQNKVKCYEQSMLVHDGYVYAVSDQGVAYCWAAADGTEMWKGRVENPVSCSLILANGNLYYASERGTTFVIMASPDRFEAVAKNKLGDSTFATPAFCNNRIYTRVAFGSKGNRREYLYCIGKKVGE